MRYRTACIVVLLLTISSTSSAQFPWQKPPPRSKEAVANILGPTAEKEPSRDLHIVWVWGIDRNHAEGAHEFVKAKDLFGRIYQETKALPQDKYVKELNRRVEDREGLFHEAMTLMARVIPQPKGKDGRPVIAYGALTKVEISGDKATGRFMEKLDDRAVLEVDGVRQTERREQVRFRKINGRWFCAMAGAY